MLLDVTPSAQLPECSSSGACRAAGMPLESRLATTAWSLLQFEVSPCPDQSTGQYPSGKLHAGCQLSCPWLLKLPRHWPPQDARLEISAHQAAHGMDPLLGLIVKAAVNLQSPSAHRSVAVCCYSPLNPLHTAKHDLRFAAAGLKSY